MQSLDDKWSERFSRLEALFLAKSFSVPVEPVKKSEVPVTDRPFIPPTAAATSTQQQKKSTGQKKAKKTSQPPEVSGVLPGSQLMSPDEVSATQPVEAPGTDTENLPADQEPTFSTTTGEKPQLHSPVLPFTPGAISTGPTVSVEEPEQEVASDQSSQSPDEGELSDRESMQGQEELIEGDQDLSAEKSYRETLRGVRSFMAWTGVRLCLFIPG